LIRAEGFGGGESTVRAYVRQRRPNPVRKAERFLPLAFDPGEAAEADWGEAEVEMVDQVVIVQYFALRLCYSRRMLVCAYPTQKQESFFDAHVRAFAFFGGVPKTIAYDNLKTAVYQVLAGRSRAEQQTFTLFRSHYLFESRYCTPGAGNEKGGVESGIGFPGATSSRPGCAAPRSKTSTSSLRRCARPTASASLTASQHPSSRCGVRNSPICGPYRAGSTNAV
jgi:transposase